MEKLIQFQEALSEISSLIISWELYNKFFQISEKCNQVTDFSFIFLLYLIFMIKSIELFNNIDSWENLYSAHISAIRCLEDSASLLSNPSIEMISHLPLEHSLAVYAPLIAPVLPSVLQAVVRHIRKRLVFTINTKTKTSRL